jgi:multidrug efflux pump subunit AcrA (membrane-fusion protein)
MENFDLREEFYSEIYMMKPKWWMRWGITAFMGIFLLLFFLAYIIRYPDIIRCDIEVSTNNPSITFQIPDDTEIEKILVKNNTTVTHRTNLLVFRNSANYQDVLMLDKDLKTISSDNKELVAFFEKYIGKEMQLGETIENEWRVFSNELLSYYKIHKLKLFKTQVTFLDEELKDLIKLKDHYAKLNQINSKQGAINEERFKTDSILFSKRVLSKGEYNNSRQSYYVKESELKQNEIQLTRIDAEIVKLNNAKKSLLSEEKQSLLAQTLSIRTSLGRLHSAVEAWKKSYLFVSPVHGKVHHLQNLEEGNFFSGKILTVLPPSSFHFVKANIVAAGAGKVKLGQRVLIKLNDYPYKEYGLIEGKLSEFSSIPGENFYVGRIKLDYENISRSAMEIKDNMRGIGEIITNDRSLLERVFSNILYVFNKK